MGSDGFESKRLGGSALAGSGTGNIASSEFSGADDRAMSTDAFASDGAGVNLVEISGVIKWFDASKGYGFIVPDNG